MSAELILSVDIGTTYIKAGLYRADSECVAAGRKKMPGRHTKSGALVQDAADYVAQFVDVVRDVMEKTQVSPKAVQAISFTGQMAGTVGLDSDMNPLTEWSGTVDSRQDLSVESKELSEETLRLSGTNTPIFAKKVQWFETRQQSQPTKVYKYAGISGYVMAKIAGLTADEAPLEATTLAFTGITDMKNRAWSKSLCDGYGIDMRKLPRIVDSMTVIGKLNRDFAQQCGLTEGTPIVAGAGDKIAGCIGTGAVSPGEIVDECSTVGALTMCVDSYKPETRAHSLEVIPGALPGSYYMMFYIAGSGVAIDWFINTFAAEECAEATAQGEDVHTLLEREAQSISPGCDGLMSIGLLGGRSLPFTPEIRGAWVGHTFSHTKAHFYRALLESLAYEYRRAIDAMRLSFPHLASDSIRVIGGGAASPLWNSIKAGVLSAAYHTMSRADTALLGASIIGGTAIGLHPSLKEGAAFAAQQKETFAADDDTKAQYANHYALYSRLVGANMKIFQQIKKGY